MIDHCYIYSADIHYYHTDYCPHQVNSDHKVIVSYQTSGGGRKGFITCYVYDHFYNTEYFLSFHLFPALSSTEF
jgi:hypothetical protein